MDLRLCMPMCKRVINTDISEDIILPDYYPEIRRVLCVRENMLPVAKFISGNKIDISGVVDYTLIYVSSEGMLCSAPLSAEYAFSVPLENVNDFELSEGVNIMAHSVADSSTVRVSGPRKLQIRSHIRSNVNAWGKMSCCESVEGIEDPASIQRLESEGVCAEMLCESSDIVTVSDQYTLPSDNARIALADSAVTIQSTRMDGEMIYASGEVIVSMLIMTDTKSEKVIRRMPFEAESDLDGVEMEGEKLLRTNGTVTELTINVEEGNALIEANLVLEICMLQNRSISYICDAYSTEQSSATDMKTYSLPIVLENKSTSFSQNERVELSELNFTEGADIIDVYGSAAVSEAVFEEGKYVVRGNCRYNIICFKDGEYSHCELRAPFRYESDGEYEIDAFDASAQVIGCKVRNDGESLSVDSEIMISYNIMGSRETEMLERVTFFDRTESCGGEWTVCYVQNGESAWNIAKRYGVRECDVKGDPATDRYVVIER